MRHIAIAGAVILYGIHYSRIYMAAILKCIGAMQNLKDDSQDSRNSDLLHLEDDLSNDLQEIIALEKIKSAPKSSKEESLGTRMDLLDSNPPRSRSKQKNMSRKEFSGADREDTSENGSYTGIIASVLVS